MLSGCTVTFSQLALASSVACGRYISLSCLTCNSTAVAQQATIDVAQIPDQPYCNDTLHLMTPGGSFTDGSPAGTNYAPSSFCQWLIDPGYRCGVLYACTVCRVPLASLSGDRLVLMVF